MAAPPQWRTAALPLYTQQVRWEEGEEEEELKLSNTSGNMCTYIQYIVPQFLGLLIFVCVVHMVHGY